MTTTYYFNDVDNLVEHILYKFPKITPLLPFTSSPFVADMKQTKTSLTVYSKLISKHGHQDPSSETFTKSSKTTATKLEPTALESKRLIWKSEIL